MGGERVRRRGRGKEELKIQGEEEEKEEKKEEEKEEEQGEGEREEASSFTAIGHRRRQVRQFQKPVLAGALVTAPQHISQGAPPSI